MSKPDDQIDDAFLRGAIRLAMNGRGAVEPNPMVACLIVKNGRVIGEGFHARFGGPHAEPIALASCTESPAGATVYVTLEPCCHTNKKTPPCAPRLIAAQVARVVIGCLDPTDDVNGRGAAMLRDAGIVVDRASTQVEAEAKQLIAPFIKRTIHRLPYVTMKWAESANGKVAGPMGRRVKITNESSDRIVHTLRARCDAIAVGTNTVLADDPMLTARGVEGAAADRSGSHPRLRVVLSNTLKLPIESKLVATARQHPTIVYCSQSALASNLATADALRSRGVEVVAMPDRESHFSFDDVLADLHARTVTNLLVEPGPTLTRYMLSRGQADRVWVFRSPNVIEDNPADLAISTAPRVEYPPIGSMNIDGDVLSEYLNPASRVFFAAVPSADFVSSQAAPR